MNIHYSAGDKTLTIQDNHPADARPSPVSTASIPLKLEEDEDFDDSFFSGATR